MIDHENVFFIRASLFQLEQAGLSRTSSSNTGGHLTCEFTRNISVPGQNNVFDLAKEKYYVMLAYGDLKSGTHALLPIQLYRLGHLPETAIRPKC